MASREAHQGSQEDQSLEEDLAFLVAQMAWEDVARKEDPLESSRKCAAYN
jgi:hypothetical protein